MVAIVIGAALMFIIPTQYYMIQKKLLVRDYIDTEVRCVTDNIRNTGILSSENYRQFREKVYSVCPGCSIQIESTGTRKEDEESQTYDEYYYTVQIEDKLDKTGSFKFRAGDFIRIRIVDSDKYMVAYYGGMIKDENY